MKLDSVRDLKSSIRERVVMPASTLGKRRRSIAVSAQPMSHLAGSCRSVALGISRKGRKRFQLAVRVQRPELVDSDEVRAIVKEARGEADVRYVGRLIKRMPATPLPWNQKRMRPLTIGTSIGHHRITAGTLGCFVTQRSDGALLVLSNNHVLANENDAAVGDEILQPGAFDGGRRNRDAIGALAKFMKLKPRAINLVDCAVASVREGIDANVNLLTGLDVLKGPGAEFLEPGAKVFKLGRTTGLTRGYVTAFELDNVVVGFDSGDLRFDGQIEIEGSGDRAFSAGGDSGALIVDEGYRGVGLLFAGGDQGGSNGKGLTYANPLAAVLDALKVDLTS